MIDTHCHIDLYNNPIAIANESEKLGIVTIGMTNLPSHFEMGIQHLVNFKKVRLALGMHPLYAERHEEEFQIFLKNISHTSYIGEVGLDFSKDGIATKEIQINSFEKILKELNGKKKILSMHSRKAENEVFSYLVNYKIESAIFHWYSGPLLLIDKICKAGYFFSINTAMVKSRSGISIISKIPLENILTETDGPFIQHNGRAVKPSDVSFIHSELAKIFKLPSEIVSEKININFKKLLSFIK